MISKLAYLLSQKIGVITSSKTINHMIESIHAATFIQLLTPKDISTINDTEMNTGPIIYGLAAA
ncbi:Hypothetical protein HVR_LOCUS1238 [uncultured virus]|nr:Hypothetical protein HVR_LOCUS1238 [uncultured virus]